MTLDIQKDSKLKAASSVNRAVVLLAISSFLLGLLKAALDWTRLTSLSGAPFTVSVLLSTFALTALLLWKIYEGRNWARITFLVLFSVGLLPWVFIVRAEFHRSMGLWLISMVQFALQTYAMVLVFTPPANEWFRAKHLPR